MKIKSLVVTCFYLNFALILCFGQAYSMGSWWGSSSSVAQKKSWVKKNKADAAHKATAAILDELIAENKYPDAVSLFSAFIQQRDDSSQYALRWAHDAADKGIFPIQYELIKYYKNILDENIAGLSAQEVQYLCELIMKSEFLVRMAYQWFCAKGDSAMAKHGLSLWQFVSGQYYNFLVALLRKYEPSYQDVYATVSSWITGQHDVLKNISPLWLTTGSIEGNKLIFGLPEEAIKSSLYGVKGIKSLHRHNRKFLRANKSLNKESHPDRESWEKFCEYLNNIAEPKKSK